MALNIEVKFNWTTNSWELYKADELIGTYATFKEAWTAKKRN